VSAQKRLPLQRRDRPGLAPEFPHRSPVELRRESSIGLVAAIALDLDTVLADTRPLWRDWLEDAARRARVDLSAVPDDRVAAAAVLDHQLGDWRPLLQRFADDRGPLHFRPRPDTGAALRRLDAAGVRIGVVTDAPRELADVALAHVGAARRIDVVGTLDEVRQELGPDVQIVRSREELADLQ
jgi:phosphoglycolate phosphatase-like HAD superfamily hydrolase